MPSTDEALDVQSKVVDKIVDLLCNFSSEILDDAYQKLQDEAVLLISINDAFTLEDLSLMPLSEILEDEEAPEGLRKALEESKEKGGVSLLIAFNGATHLRVVHMDGEINAKGGNA